MGTLNLTAVRPDTPYIKKIKAALEKGTGDKIPIVEVKKVQRKGGVSTSPVFFRFAGGQELVLYVRASADVIKAELNGKEIVLPGDFSDDYQPTFDNAVSGVASLVRKAQSMIDEQNKKDKVKLPPRNNRGITQQLNDKREEESQLDKEIAGLTSQRDQLLEQLRQVQSHKEGGASSVGKLFDSVDGENHNLPIIDIPKGILEAFPVFEKVKDLKKYLLGKFSSLPPIVNKTSQHPIKFFSSGIESSLKIKTKFTQSFYEALPILLKEAQFIELQPVHEGKNKPHVLGYEIYEAMARLSDGNIHKVIIKVEVVKNDLRMRSYYFHSVE